MLERDYQGRLIKKIKQRFEGCLILKTDPNYIQGFPDLLVLYKDHWAALETKRSSGALHRPNQDYYVGLLNGMSYSAFISPDNEEVVLNALSESFRT